MTYSQALTELEARGTRAGNKDLTRKAFAAALMRGGCPVCPPRYKRGRCDTCPARETVDGQPLCSVVGRALETMRVNGMDRQEVLRVWLAATHEFRRVLHAPEPPRMWRGKDWRLPYAIQIGPCPAEA